MCVWGGGGGGTTSAPVGPQKCPFVGDWDRAVFGGRSDSLAVDITTPPRLHAPVGLGLGLGLGLRGGAPRAVYSGGLQPQKWQQFSEFWDAYVQRKEREQTQGAGHCSGLLFGRVGDAHDSVALGGVPVPSTTFVSQGHRDNGSGQGCGGHAMHRDGRGMSRWCRWGTPRQSVPGVGRVACAGPPSALSQTGQFDTTAARLGAPGADLPPTPSHRAMPRAVTPDATGPLHQRPLCGECLLPHILRPWAGPRDIVQCALESVSQAPVKWSR